MKNRFLWAWRGTWPEAISASAMLTNTYSRQISTNTNVLFDRIVPGDIVVRSVDPHVMIVNYVIGERGTRNNEGNREGMIYVIQARGGLNEAGYRGQVTDRFTWRDMVEPGKAYSARRLIYE